MNKNDKILLSIGMIISISILILFLEPLKHFIYEYTSVGLNLKEVVIYSLIITISILVLLAVVSEGGLLGEVQYLLTSFLLYFFVSFLIIGYIW